MDVFWLLILSHFIADYPFQPGWLVQKKSKLWALTLHVSIHLAVMLVLTGASRWVLAWPYLITITAIHFFIDVGKNLVWTWRPQWVAGPYLIDQILHVMTLLFVANWIFNTVPVEQLPAGSPWIIYAIGFLLATYVWYITEYVIIPKTEAYHPEVVRTIWSRMLTRAAFLALFVILLNLFGPQIHASLAAVPIISASIFVLPYAADCYWKRALATDLTVALFCSMLIFLAA